MSGEVGEAEDPKILDRSKETLGGLSGGPAGSPKSTPPAKTEREKELEQRLQAAVEETAIMRERASEFQETARRDKSEVAKLKVENTHLKDEIVGTHRGLRTRFQSHIALLLLAMSITHSYDGAYDFLNGPKVNRWPYIIFGTGILVVLLLIVEVPYIKGSSVGIALAGLAIASLFLLALVQMRRSVPRG